MLGVRIINKMKFRDRFPSQEYPISDDLCIFWDNHPDMFQSLKLSNQSRFKFIKVIFCSYSPTGHQNCNDEVIGMWYYDMNKGIFKQDFIVNIEAKGKKYISYSTNNNNGKYVRPIKEFFEKYGQNGKFYHDDKRWQHHYNAIDDLPDEENLKFLAKKVFTSHSTALAIFSISKIGGVSC